jgi:hypothetical protein
MAGILFSKDAPPFEWSEAISNRIYYGPKGSMLAALPRAWTPSFVLIPASVFAVPDQAGNVLLALGEAFLSRVRLLAGPGGNLIVRSSVIEESIWDRGTYASVLISGDMNGFEARLSDGVSRVITSADGKSGGLVIQRHVPLTCPDSSDHG